jgi:hypothetical protein
VPWLVAEEIDPVGDEGATQLSSLGVNPDRLTLIGEGFGNCVNARIAKNLGEVKCILALKPASEHGGYSPLASASILTSRGRSTRNPAGVTEGDVAGR